MNERRIVPRNELIFNPIAKLPTQQEIGRVLDISHLGLSILSKQEYPIYDSFDLIVEDEGYDELKGKSLQLKIEILRCTKSKNDYYELGCRILEIKKEEDYLLVNKMIRLLGEHPV